MHSLSLGVALLLLSVYVIIPSSNRHLAMAHEDHAHFRPKRDNEFHDRRFTTDTQHIKEDLEKFFNVSDKDFSQLSDDELEFYYFELHDFDKNGKLDGLEMLRAVQHVVEHDQHSTHIDVARHIDDYTMAIDEVYKNDDLDKDGFLTYHEFVYAQKKYNTL